MRMSRRVKVFLLEVDVGVSKVNSGWPEAMASEAMAYILETTEGLKE